MHRWRPHYLFLALALLVSCAGARHTHLYASFSVLGSEVHELRAVDTIPPAIPAVKQTEERTEKRMTMEELPFVVVIASAFIPKKTLHVVTRHRKNTHERISKYLKNVIFRQTIQ